MVQSLHHGNFQENVNLRGELQRLRAQMPQATEGGWGLGLSGLSTKNDSNNGIINNGK